MLQADRYILHASCVNSDIIRDAILTTFLLFPKVVKFMTDQVKIVLDAASVNKFRTEIDAVRLIGSTLSEGKIYQLDPWIFIC